ncbi:MAG TPA: hypothetical protein PKD10_02175 [Paracoccaceae bacterium]|nr:hypothetical protein [Paracoccaceae bacterium]HMO72210.1 hypothetical protein [Paracoccaceae bacterium]
MPEGQNAPVIDVAIRDWIQKFNKAKGWDSYSVPKPESLKVKDPAAKLKASPKSFYDKGLDEIGKREDVVSALDDAKKAVADLMVALGNETDPAKIRQLEKELQEKEEELSEQQAELDLFDRYTKRMKQVQDAEQDLPKELADLGVSIEGLRDQVEKGAVDLATLDAGELARFRDFHDMVSKNVEKWRQEVIPLTRETDSGTETQYFAVLNSKEYKLLFGMLEEAILLLQLGKLDEAKAKVQAVSDLMVEFRNARTGAEPITQREQLDPALDEPLMQAEASIEALRRGGFGFCADARQTEFDTLTGKIRTEKSAKTPDIGKLFKAEASGLVLALRQDVEAMHKVEKLIGEAAQDRLSMLANGHVHRPKRIQDMINKFIPGPKAADNVVAAMEIRTYAAEKLKEATDADLKGAKIDKPKLDKQHEEMKKRYAQLAEQIKKLPPEVKSEIDLQLLAAGQLLESDSVDALREAQRYLKGIDIFIGNIEKYPKVYADFKERLANTDKAIKKIGSDYPMYEIGARSDLQLELDLLVKSYMTRNQKQVLDSITDIDKRVGEFRDLCKELRGKKRVAFKMADALTKSLDEVGKTLEKHLSDGFVKFDGYHGSLRGELGTARAKVEKRTEEMIDAGTKDLTDLKIKVDALVKNIAAYRSDKGKMKPADLQSVTGFLSDARNAQVDHDNNEAKKKEFEAAKDEVKKAVEKAQKAYKAIKADPSDLDAIETERETIGKEIKTSHAYIDGLKRMKTLLARVQKLAASAGLASEILDATMGDAAKTCVEKVNAFRTGLRTLFDGAIYKAAKTDKGNPFDDGTYDAAKVRGFLGSIVAAVPQKALDELPGLAAKVGDDKLAVGPRRDARKAALAHVRSLMAVLDGFKPVAHLRINPFDADITGALNTARQVLPRLEMRLLTAIKE